MASQTPPLQDRLKTLYAEYRHTNDIDEKARFFSPNCLQICRPNPPFCAKDSQTIIGYLHQVADKSLVFERDNAKGGATAPGKSLYTIRPLSPEEALDFASDEIVAPLGLTAAALSSRAEAERWQGMRVDLWDSDVEALLVKVQYWWRVENGQWVQILHDILYIGPRDGTEGLDQDAILE